MKIIAHCNVIGQEPDWVAARGVFGATF